MADLTTYAETQIADWICGGATPTQPVARYLALFTAAPSDAGGGTEVDGSGYARQAVTFGAASSGVSANTAPVSFGPAGASWGSIVAVGLFDAVSGGYLWAWKEISAATVGSGLELKFAVGDITFEMD
jgi:hypothetical protein